MTQEQVLIQHEDLVGRAAAWALRRIKGSACALDRDDLMQHGKMALLKARAEFSGGGQFEPFAMQRMKWALLDVIREAGPIGRRHRVAIKAGLSPAITLRSIDATIDRDIVGPEGADPLAGIEHERLRALVDQLPARLRRIVIEYHFDGKNMREISVGLGVNESRVCQLHKRALASLRALMEGRPLPVDSAPLDGVARETLARLQRLEKAIESDARRLSGIERSLVAIEQADRLSSHRYGETVSIHQAAKICGVARRTIYNWINDGKLHVARTPGGSIRIDKASLLTWDAPVHGSTPS